MLHQLDTQEIKELIATGKLTSEAFVRSCLARIKINDKVIGAWEHLDSQLAIQQALTLDKRLSHGALHGIPVGVKDLFDTCDMPTAYGSDIYRNYRPSWDAAVVSALRASGAVILGKTVTTEFATYRPGRTTNPHAPEHTPGGSSSGSAAAVADGMVPLALGTQTAGSVIRPASYCGVVGYKPTYGFIHRAGIKLISESLDTIGTFTRTVADAALLASVLSGRSDLHPVKMSTQPPRIGLCQTPQWDYAETATTTVFYRAAELLQKAGAQVVDTHLPEAFDGLATAQEDIMAYEATRGLAFESNNHRDKLSSKLSMLLTSGTEITPKCYDHALRQADSCRSNLNEVFKDLDVILAPSAPGEAPKGLDSTGDPIFSRIWTLLHTPCINLPGFRGPGGLPVGIQLIGKVGRDAELLAAARWVEQQMPDAFI